MLFVLFCLFFFLSRTALHLWQDKTLRDAFIARVSARSAPRVDAGRARILPA